ncbi:MAG: GUN4 domain-containing protein [Cyanobacteria bacterium J069]|nr:MAG: GUN4 domain-containing protein [Cyanobacteria bacterium J069]
MDNVPANLSQSPLDHPVSSEPGAADFIADFLTRLQSENEKTQLQLIQDIAGQGESGLTVLMRVLQDYQGHKPGLLAGKAVQLLTASSSPQAQAFLQSQFPQGLVPVRSQRSIDYAPLQALLAKQDFQTADRVTLEKMCELAGPTALQRRWIYFTEVEDFPAEDLQTINTLWVVYSEGKFGFSVQRDLWLGVGKNWERLWPLIGWKAGNTWTRYPGGFTWNLTAPRGHLPLSNQLRGVRTMSSLLTHPAWTGQ